ncbi:hypothetical protein HAX54_023696, partial [Datura stramonium]|nr:hypothetical protein [Datura stramonium]
DVEEKAPKFYARLQEMGWDPLVKEHCKANEAWVREFYVNIPIVDWNRRELVTYVKGRLILLSPTAINEALDLPYPPEDELKAQYMDGNGQWLVDTLVVEEQSASTNWGITQTDIRCTHFMVEARRWLNLMSRRIQTCSIGFKIENSRILAFCLTTSIA